MKVTLARSTVALFLSISAGSVLAADIVDTAATDRSFNTFVTALESTSVASTLKNSGPYTVFAPTNEAFAKLPPGTWENLSKDKEKLKQVLAYHIIPGKITVSEIKPGNVNTTEGHTLKLTSDNGKVTVNEANIIQSDLAADNGVIHAIDAVVLPPQ
jgi:uncharacterized surface protein with fasciclin (FAS1) repeats